MCLPAPEKSIKHTHRCDDRGSFVERRSLAWPRLKHWTLVKLFEQLLPVAVSVGFSLAWIVILLKMKTG
jgi:hypothetical protein